VRPEPVFRLAGWSKDDDGVLDPKRVACIRIGWGGYYGTEGENRASSAPHVLSLAECQATVNNCPVPCPSAWTHPPQPYCSFIRHIPMNRDNDFRSVLPMHRKNQIFSISSSVYRLYCQPAAYDGQQIF
jgi:hypothetical protein